MNIFLEEPIINEKIIKKRRKIFGRYPVNSLTL
jgi:hypothetical protein